SRVDEIVLAAPARVQTLCFGPADFAADLGIDLTLDGTELLYARSRVVVAARAGGLAAPIDGPFLLGLHDSDALLRACRRRRHLGFGGKLVISPPPVNVVSRAFSEVSSDELDRA